MTNFYYIKNYKKCEYYKKIKKQEYFMKVMVLCTVPKIMSYNIYQGVISNLPI